MGAQYSSVAERVMKNHGWKKGQGLGASNQGIHDPIKPSLKFDTTGIGHDPAAEFTSNLWGSNYNKAASAIQVVIDSDSSDEGGETVKVVAKKSADAKENKKNALYARFVNTATLDSGTMVSRVSEVAKDSDDDDDDDEKEGGSKGRERLDDNQLFEACGGMTAHKGARHGHNMKAKQDRIARMEAKLLRKMEAEDGAKRGTTQTKSKKRKKTSEGESEAAAKKRSKSKKEKKKKKTRKNNEGGTGGS